MKEKGNFKLRLNNHVYQMWSKTLKFLFSIFSSAGVFPFEQSVHLLLAGYSCWSSGLGSVRLALKYLCPGGITQLSPGPWLFFVLWAFCFLKVFCAALEDRNKNCGAPISRSRAESLRPPLFGAPSGKRSQPL